MTAATRPRLLDLFCGAGGAAAGYHRAGFEVTGVDIAPQPNFPYAFVEADALAILRDVDLSGYHAIHASPPCQAYSTKTRNKSDHPDLYAQTRDLLRSTGVPWVIENVMGAPYESGTMLCGSMFGLRVRRHRNFESSFPITQPPCQHAWQDADKRFRLYDHGKWFQSGIVHVFGTGGGKGRGCWPEAMGIDWMTDRELTEAIPPRYTEWVGHALLKEIS